MTGSSPRLRAVAAAAWRFRWIVECDAETRFLGLADRLDALGAYPSPIPSPLRGEGRERDAPAPVPDLARRAAADERRHAAHCARIAAELGGPVPAAAPAPPAAVAPGSLEEEDAVTYELVAACCIAETVSVGVLTALLPVARDPGLRAVLHELATDEVLHARLGWAHLATAAARGRVAFLAPLLPAMLAGSVDEDLFREVGPDLEDEGLLALGVLPHRMKRELFAGAIEEVVLPGLSRAAVDTAAAARWLASQRAR
ncbi:MAG TPA: ferritin-like domain-containing protein [Anaeromyxobacter sp.]